MDLSKLDRNEKLAVYGSAALIIGGIIGYSYGLTVLGMLAAIAMLAIVLLPQVSPSTSLPGSHGSLMLAVGGLAGVVMLLAFLQAIAGVLLVNTNLRDLFFVVAVAGGVLMAWAGWQEFQAEGGKFQLGNSSHASASEAPAAVETTRGAEATHAGTTDDPAGRDDPATDDTEEGRPVA